MIDPKKVDALKAWYAIFVTIIDDAQMADDVKLHKLRQLRETIKRGAPGLEAS